MDTWIIWLVREYGNYTIPGAIFALLIIFGYQAYKRRV